MVASHTKVQASKTSGSLIDEIMARHEAEQIRDDDVTILRMTRKTGWGRSKCESSITDDVEAGLLVEVIVLDERNHKTRAWRKPESK